MSTTQIVVIVVALLIAVVVIALLVKSMKARSRADDSARAEQLRRKADEHAAATLPDSQVRAERAEAEAEQARRAAEAAEERASEAKVEVAQQEAVHEDQVRAADRLDPDVDHRADDYTPQSDLGRTTAAGAAMGTAAGATAGSTTHNGPDTILDDDGHGHTDSGHTDTAHTDASHTEAGSDYARSDEVRHEDPTVESPDDRSSKAQEPMDEQPTDEQATSTSSEELDADGGTPGRPPLGGLPRRTPGAQEMPGRPVESDGGGSLFKRRDDSSS